jgi:hypothetical protein
MHGRLFRNLATECSCISAKILNMHEVDEVNEGEERSRKRWCGMEKREGMNDIKGAMLVVVATMVMVMGGGGGFRSMTMGSKRGRGGQGCVRLKVWKAWVATQERERSQGGP